MKNILLLIVLLFAALLPVHAFAHGPSKTEKTAPDNFVGLETDAGRTVVAFHDANLVINEAIRLFAGDSQLCALKAFPLQFEGSLDQEKLEHDEWITGMKFDGFCGCETSAMLKLTQFYQTIGFFSFSENKNYMIRKIE